MTVSRDGGTLISTFVEFGGMRGVVTMRRGWAAAIGSAAFFVVAPGTVAGLIPYWLTDWQFHGPVVLRILGVLVTGAGLVPLVHTFVQFTRAGGTPMPIAPTQHLVVNGFHRYLRNPMYAAVLTVILGQALLFGSLTLLVYAAICWAVSATFVRLYEEPTLARQFGAEYEAYKRAVPAWWPRLHAYPGG
jgi:protein-S-isoprenylcysteine O-methyltransferase Ste14